MEGARSHSVLGVQHYGQRKGDLVGREVCSTTAMQLGQDLQGGLAAVAAPVCPRCSELVGALLRSRSIGTSLVTGFEELERGLTSSRVGWLRSRLRPPSARPYLGAEPARASGVPEHGGSDPPGPRWTWGVENHRCCGAWGVRPLPAEAHAALHLREVQQDDAVVAFALPPNPASLASRFAGRMWSAAVLST